MDKMDQELNTEEQGLVRIGKRVYVGNLAWKTSWQDLKVGGGLDTMRWTNLTRRSPCRITSGAAAMWCMPT